MERLTVEFHSWGAVLRLQKPYVDKLVRLLRTGAGAAAVANLFPPLAGYAAALSAVLSLGAAVIENCAGPRGVDLYLSYSGLPWCSEL
ncbi:hypothetical protein [Streptomyces sp. NPDC088350]|uniref:hypothetical protein n=1 Tax=Streptomyces sp. NPDC088350 TaxID=3365854 RepID=UPI00380D7134